MNIFFLTITHRIWNTKISETLCKAYETGVINSHQLHELAAKFDPTQNHSMYPRIDCSKVYDGQSAFRNGIHDAIRLPRETSLYRFGYPGGMWGHFRWKIGNHLGRLAIVKRVVKT